MAALLQVLLCSALVALVCCDGVMHLLMEEYDNPGGKLENGHCCDGKYFLCQHHGCDHMFSICVDEAAGSDDVRSCVFGERMSDKIKNQDNNIFGPDINGLANPMRFDVVGEIPVDVTLKVVVKDKDTGHFWLGHNDQVEVLQGGAAVSTAPRGQADARRQTLSGRTSLYYKLWFTCDENYYGPRCGVHCPPPTTNQHYTCDEHTGEKVCYRGFAGDNCDRRVRPTRRPYVTWRPWADK